MRYEQTQSGRLQSRQTRNVNIENAERVVIQSIATNMHLRRSVKRAKTKGPNGQSLSDTRNQDLVQYP